MKKILIRNLLAITLFGFFTQFSVAHHTNNMSAIKEMATALKEIANIVVSINHFPSDADKAALAKISGNEAYPQGIRDMATTVSNIEHAANDAGKAAMARIQASDQASASAKALAGMITNFNHMLNAEAKMTMAQLFP
jgi:hypothetical protein